MLLAELAQRRLTIAYEQNTVQINERKLRWLFLIWKWPLYLSQVPTHSSYLISSLLFRLIKSYLIWSDFAADLFFAFFCVFFKTTFAFTKLIKLKTKNNFLEVNIQLTDWVIRHQKQSQKTKTDEASSDKQPINPLIYFKHHLPLFLTFSFFYSRPSLPALLYILMFFVFV